MGRGNAVTIFDFVLKMEIVVCQLEKESNLDYIGEERSRVIFLKSLH